MKTTLKIIYNQVGTFIDKVANKLAITNKTHDENPIQRFTLKKKLKKNFFDY